MIRSRRWLSSCALACLALTAGCYKATFYRDPQVTSGDRHEEWTNFYVFGLVGSEVIDVRRYCPPNAVATVRTGGNLGTGVVSVITLGIYTPHKVYVTCAAPAHAACTSNAGSVANAWSNEVVQ
jgi:hypothetical protein